MNRPVLFDQGDAARLGSHPGCAVSIYQYTPDIAVANGIGEVVAILVAGLLAGCRVEPDEPVAVGADPQITKLVQGHGANTGTSFTARLACKADVVTECSVGLHAAQTAARAYPNGAVGRLCNCPHAVVREARRVVRVVTKMPEGFGVCLEQVQAAVGSYPDSTVAVFENVVDPAIRKAVRLVRRVVEDLEVIAVVAVQSLLGADPDKPLTVLNDALGRRVRDAVVRCDAGEGDFLGVREFLMGEGRHRSGGQ